MNLKFSSKKITGILGILPRNEVKFDDEIENYNFTIAQSIKLKKVMGYGKHRLVTDGVCTSDIAIAGLNYLFDNNHLKKNDIDALILVTQTPDYIMPSTSSVIHGALGLKQDMFCIDINQGCAGYLIGLYEGFMLLEQESVHKVVLINADVLSRKVSKQDRNSFPLTGDAGSITIIEKDENAGTIHANLKNNGGGWDALLIPAGGMRQPITNETGVIVDDGKGNLRSKEHLVMKGDAVFNFVQTEVPPMIESLLATAQLPLEQVDYFMFHQPNKFMLQKLASKIGVPERKMPNNIVENFGNSSGVTIPLAITFNLAESIKRNNYKMCLAGFGVGLTWSSMLLDLGNLDFCRIIEF